MTTHGQPNRTPKTGLAIAHIMHRNHSNGTRPGLREVAGPGLFAPLLRRLVRQGQGTAAEGRLVVDGPIERRNRQTMRSQIGQYVPPSAGYTIIL